MSAFHVLFAYFGPETMLPVTSVVATVVGVFLMMGRAGWRLLFGRKLFRPGPAPASILRGHHLAGRGRTSGPVGGRDASHVCLSADAVPAEPAD